MGSWQKNPWIPSEDAALQGRASRVVLFSLSLDEPLVWSRVKGFVGFEEQGMNSVKVRLLPSVELSWNKLHTPVAVPSIFGQPWLVKLRCQDSPKWRLLLGSCCCHNCTSGLIPGRKEIEMKWQINVCPAENQQILFFLEPGIRRWRCRQVCEQSVLRKGSSALGLGTRICSGIAEEVSDLSPFINFPLFVLSLLSWNRAHCFQGLLGASGDAWLNFRSDRIESVGGTIASLQKCPKTLAEFSKLKSCIWPLFLLLNQ